MLEIGGDGGSSGKLLRGAQESAGNGVYRAGRLEIRPAEHAAFADGRPLSLTVRELALLSELARNTGRILTREQLFEAVWGGQRREADRSVDVYVSRVRTKLAAALPGIEFIHTHFGIGYRFSAGSEAGS